MKNTREGETVIAVFVDLPHASETKNRSILVKKLRIYGVEECVLKWTEDY